MHFSAACTLGALASVVTAYTYPDHVPLHRRQAAGTPEYECHANCEDYCSSSNFTIQLEQCLNCANEFDIWRYYGESVEKAATACGVEAEPVAAVTASSTSVAAESASPAASAPVSGTETGAEAAGSEAAESDSAATSASPSATSANEEATETQSAEDAPATYTGAGIQHVIGYGMAMLPVGIAAMVLP